MSVWGESDQGGNDYNTILRSKFDAHVAKKGRVKGVAARRHLVRLRREFREKANHSVNKQQAMRLERQLRAMEIEQRKTAEERDRLRAEVCLLRIAASACAVSAHGPRGHRKSARVQPGAIDRTLRLNVHLVGLGCARSVAPDSTRTY